MIYMADVRLMFPFERNNLDRTLDNSQSIKLGPGDSFKLRSLNCYSTMFFRLTFVPVLKKNHQTGDKNNFLIQVLHL